MSEETSLTARMSARMWLLVLGAFALVPFHTYPSRRPPDAPPVCADCLREFDITNNVPDLCSVMAQQQLSRGKRPPHCW